MFLKRFYDEKLAQASYLVGCPQTGEALVVDPNRAVARYVEAARGQGLRVTHVTETHIHADFVSGALELARRAGARLYLSGAGDADWQYRYAGEAGADLLYDGSCFSVGGLELEAMHTPGHTPENLTFLVTDTAATRDPMGAFTGDFLFVGDVGRPDLLEKAAQAQGTMTACARHLFASLQRFRGLPDYLQIWPGHGAGSACGKSLGAVPQSTLGYEKLVNWAFAIEDEEEFVRAVLDGQPDPPKYFAMMKTINREGPPALESAGPMRRLPADRLAPALAEAAVVIDVRPALDFAGGAVSGTINIPWSKSFTTYAGTVLPYDRDLYLITSDDGGPSPEEIGRELSGIGLDRVGGYFGVDALERNAKGAPPLETMASLDAAELERRSGTVSLIDVRSAGEFTGGHLPGALNIPLGSLSERLREIPHDRPAVVHCQSGSRATIAASVLKASGFSDVRVFRGGFAEWKGSGRAVE